MASTRKSQRAGRARGPVAGQRLREPGRGVLSPELRRFFDVMASRFPGHVMQRLMRPDGSVRYTYVSPGLEALGLDPREILAASTSTQDWIHPDDKARWRAALSTSAATLETLDEEVRVIGKDGRLRWIRSIGNPRRLKNGDTVWDGIALDVTDKREALNAMQLAKAQADSAEAQKARLLANLSAVLDEPNRVLKQLALQSAPPLDGATSGALKRAAAALDRAIALLQSGNADDVSGEAVYPDSRMADLTPRQRDVLDLLGEGLSNRDIAARLGIAEGTVKLHVNSVLRALDLSNRTQAGALVVRASIIGGRPDTA